VTKKLPITIACNEYDRTRPIKDGRVPVEGCEVTYLTYEAEEMFFRGFRNDEFDVAELSFSGYLIMAARDECPYIAIPAFVSRFFRHSSIYIRTDRGIRSPADLKGRLVGLPEYSQTAIVWMRGIFKEEFGLDPRDVHWRSGGLEESGRDERVPLKLANGVDLQPLAPGETLNRMLVEGKLDAVITARALACFVNKAPNIGRLFPNYREVEKAYYQRSGIFPIMHIIGIHRSLVEKHPWLPANLYKAFCQAKAIALNEVREMGWPHVTLPWAEPEMAETMALMGADYWRYGVAESAHEIETLIRYAYDQGLLARQPGVEELFARSTLVTSKI
jgi:4,5-dihydroxyphthalate decarboxylase